MMKITHGLLNINKPIGMSSHDVVNAIRRIFDTRRVGHAGTLDVEASGVLLVGVNAGTKLLHHLQGAQKTYEFEMAIGQETDTLDHTGKIIKTGPLITQEWLDLAAFQGTYEQVPPAYSAVKVQGKKLYEYARNNEPIPEVRARLITIDSLTQLSPFSAVDDTLNATFSVTASSGLYVRKLALDVATFYGTVAHTTMIDRLAVGRFTKSDSVPLNDVTEASLIRLSEALPDFYQARYEDCNASDITNGRPLHIGYQTPFLKVVDDAGNLYGIYVWEDAVYRPLRMFKGD